MEMQNSLTLFRRLDLRRSSVPTIMASEMQRAVNASLHPHGVAKGVACCFFTLATIRKLVCRANRRIRSADRTFWPYVCRKKIKGQYGLFYRIYGVLRSSTMG